MLLIKNINLSIDTDFSNLGPTAARILHLKEENIISSKLYRRSLDARHRNKIVYCCSILVQTNVNETKLAKEIKDATIYIPDVYEFKKSISAERPVVVGFGPAGMFAAYAFAMAGLRPIVIERGFDVDKRSRDIEEFFKGGALNPESNVQFGEGGAGTFSDGKLNTGIKDARCRVVLETLVNHGADDKILYESKPHIGTDILKVVVKNMRGAIKELGGEIFFGCRMDDILFENGRVTGIIVNKTEKINCRYLVLACGHSARDTFIMLKNKGFSMHRKPFSVGARIEHLQTDINKCLFGELYDDKRIGAADYKMATHLKNGRGVYTFCMCPGGEVINASSEEGAVCVNGMSYAARNGKNANSAVLCDIRPDDLRGDDVLEGIYLQREIERKAYNVAQGAVPFCYVGDLFENEIVDMSKIIPTVKPGVKRADIYDVLPDFVVDSIKEALQIFDKKIKGFADAGVPLTFPETRSSSPVRILRGENYEAVLHPGVFPAGEGPGYAGGIMSAAVDGLKVAEAVIEILNQ